METVTSLVMNTSANRTGVRILALTGGRCQAPRGADYNGKTIYFEFSIG